MSPSSREQRRQREDGETAPGRRRLRLLFYTAALAILAGVLLAVDNPQQPSPIIKSPGTTNSDPRTSYVYGGFFLPSPPPSTGFHVSRSPLPSPQQNSQGFPIQNARKGGPSTGAMGSGAFSTQGSSAGAANASH